MAIDAADEGAGEHRDGVAVGAHDGHGDVRDAMALLAVALPVAEPAHAREQALERGRGHADLAFEHLVLAQHLGAPRLRLEGEKRVP